jgi:hypothetical protein
MSIQERDYYRTGKAARKAGVSMSSILRYVSRGVKLANGSVVKMQCLRMGGLLLFCDEWLDEFARLQNPKQELSEKSPIESKSQKDRRIEMQLEMKLAEV